MIKILDKDTIEKIAAGEVVERPLSVVKELVENSIDAGADAIAVEIRKGGKEYIRVSDNGCGIAAGEAELAFSPHATSKISASSDLDAVRTLGFRGEALSSIAAVSRLQMISRREEEVAGVKMEIEGSEIVEKTVSGADRGTTIVVRDLFYNTPARRKFMKSDSGESSAVIDYVSKTAVSMPDIRFRMINNGNNLFTTRGKGERTQAIYTVYGRNLSRSLVHIEAEEGGLYLDGYISDTGESRPNRRSQIFFVNGRLVDNRTMAAGLERGYDQRLFPGRFPVAFLFLELDPKDTDVNIHPNKREIRFGDEAGIEDFVCRAVKAGLASEEAAPKPAIKAAEQVRKAPPARKAPVVRVNQEKLDIKNLSSLREPEPVYNVPETPAVSKAFDFRELSIIGRVFSTYIIGEAEDAFYLIDQHAAHERILYERLMKSFDEEEKRGQTLMFPLIIDIPSYDGPVIDSIISAASGLGFTMEAFGGGSFRVTEIPMYMQPGEAEAFLNDLAAGGDLRSRRTLEDIAGKACRSAVKAGDRLNSTSMDALLADLMACDNPYSCPHGRPTYIKYSRSQIERMFRR